MLIQELKEILQDLAGFCRILQAHIFQDTHFESSQIHSLTMMYRFEHTNHDILLTFLISKSLQTLFAYP